MRTTTRTNSRRAAWLAAAFLLSMLAAAWFPPPAVAEQPAPYALIFGTVYNAGGHPVRGVEIKIRLADKKRARWRLFSDRRGEFAQRVPAGKAEYVVWADVKRKKGESSNPPEVRVFIQNDERKDISLHLK